MFKKAVLPHPQFYLVHFIKNSYASSWVFIHGGPGYNCGTIEYLIEHDRLFNSLHDNIVLYDQRTCGRSIHFPEEVTHTDTEIQISCLPLIEKTTDSMLKMYLN